MSMFYEHLVTSYISLVKFQESHVKFHLLKSSEICLGLGCLLFSVRTTIVVLSDPTSVLEKFDFSCLNQELQI